jgi:hypothetical protein
MTLIKMLIPITALLSVMPWTLILKPRNSLLLVFIFSLLTFWACLKPDPEPLPPVECETGYHTCGEDSQECCLDTSAHGFDWELHLIGGNLSHFMDVWIENANDIWVVGDIHADSGLYNLARWDGVDWTLTAIAPTGYVIRLNSIYKFSETDIWFTFGSLPVHYDGISYRLFTPADDQYPSNGGEKYDVWGRSSSDMYFAGGGGQVIHYDGTVFRSLWTGTTVDLREIHVSDDGEHIFFQGYHSRGYASVLLELYEGRFNTIYECETLLPEEGNYGKIYSSYLWGNTIYSSTKAGVWQYNYINKTHHLVPDEITQTGNLYTRTIVGNNANDYIMAGKSFEIIHYNGIDYNHNYQIKETVRDWLAQYGGDMKGNLAVFGGAIDVAGNNQGVVVIGRR